MNNQKYISFLLLIFVVLFSLSVSFAEDTANVNDMQQVNDIDSIKENVIQDEKLSSQNAVKDLSGDEIQNTLGNIGGADVSNLENGTQSNADEKVEASQFDVVLSSKPTTNTVEAIQSNVDNLFDGGIVDLSNFAEYDFKGSTLNISNSNIVLKGNGNTIIKGYGDGNGLIYVTGSNVAIQGINFIDTKPGNNLVYNGNVAGWGVRFNGVTGGLVDNCTFRDFNIDINIKSCNNLTIQNSEFNGGYATKLLNDPSVNNEEGTRALNIMGSTRTTIKNNRFVGPILNAVTLASASGFTIIDNNTFYGNAYSIYIGGASSKNSVIRKNSFIACGYFKEGTIEFKGLPVISMQKASNDIAIEDNSFGVVEDNVLIAAEQGNEAHGLSSELGNINVTGNVAVKYSDDIDASGSVLFAITCRGGNPINPTAPIRVLDNIVDEGINVLKVTYVDSEGTSVDVETDKWAVAKGYVIKNETSNGEPDCYLFVPDIEFNYGETGLVEITVEGEGGALVDAEILNCDGYKITHNQNNISISNLDAGNYTLSVTYGFGENYEYEITNTSTITVKKVDVRFSLSDISFDYGKSVSTTVTLKGASGFTASVVDHPNAAKVSGNVITISGLDEGSYTLSVTSIPDSNHNAVTKTATVTVNKVDSSVNFGNNAIVFDYGTSGFTTVTLGGASGFTASAVGNPNAAKVIGNIVTVSGLGAGSYVLSVTSVPDSHHKAVTRTIPIIVNKANVNIKVSKFKVAHKGSKTWTIKVTDAHGNAVSGVGVTLKVYTGSHAKTYTLFTNSKGVINFKASALSVGTHKVVFKVSDFNYDSKEVTSSVKVVKAKSLSFSVKRESIKKGTSLTVTVKSGGKNFKTGIKLKLLIYNGKKLYKTVTLKIKKFKNKNAYGIGYATNALSKGTHTVKIVPYDDVHYKGQKKTSIVVKKKGTWTKTS